jgi:hypothetical protein
MELHAALYSAVDAALTELGSNLRDSIISTLTQKNISLTPEYTDIVKVDSVIRSMVGVGADVVMYMVYRKLCNQLQVKNYSTTINGAKPLDKILGLIELKTI